MGYIILNTDREDEMKNLRTNMRRNMAMRHVGNMPMMRHDGGMDMEKEKMYEIGFKHGWEDAEENFRRQRDGLGCFI